MRPVVPRKRWAIQKHNLADEVGKSYTDYKKDARNQPRKLMKHCSRKWKHAAGDAIVLSQRDREAMAMNMADAEEIIKRAAEARKRFQLVLPEVG